MTPAELAALERRVVDAVISQVRRELEVDKRRTISEIDKEWRGALAGLEQHLELRVGAAAANASRIAVEDALSPYLGGVQQVRELATLIVEARATREERDVLLAASRDALAKFVALEQAKLEMTKAQRDDAEAKVVALERKHGRRTATLTAIAALLTALSALGGASCGSWFQKR